MRYLEMRRHSRRVQPNEHLSQEGVDLARRIGEGAGPFDLVVASPLPRTAETAVAMGFAVDETYQPVDFTDDERKTLSNLLSPPEIDLGERARRLKSTDLSVRFLSALHQQWTEYADRLGNEERALIISHGGYLDDSAIACLPEENHSEWGPWFERCEGILLGYDGEGFKTWEMLRLS